MGLRETIKNLTFEKRVKYFSLVSLVFTIIVAIAKFIAAFVFRNYFLGIAGLFSIFIFLSKGECLLGLFFKNRSFKFRNILIFLFLLIAGVIYTAYSFRLILYEDYVIYNYSMRLGLLISLVSFIEITFAIIGLFRVKKYGHYYRDIKIISFITALTALVLTEAAILSFTMTDIEKIKLNNGIFGVVVGIITIILSIFIFFAPKISIIDREHNMYKVVDEEKSKIYFDTNNLLELPLSFSHIFKRYVFKAYCKNGIVDGHISRTPDLFMKSNIYLKIFFIIFLPIYFIPLILLRLIYFFRTMNIPKKLDKKMEEHGFIKINNQE